jgi:uncharacterized protein YkuJ
MKHLLLYSALFITVFLGACKKGEKQTENQAQEIQAPSQNQANPLPPEVTNPPVIITVNGDKFASISFGNDNKVVIEVANQNILVHKRKEDKRKYEINGTIISEIKYKDDGLKLRTADGQLKWKVKFDDNKTKISDNEENNNPFELKVNENKAKIKRNDKQISEATEVKQKVTVKSATKTYEIDHENFNKAYAILGVEEISEQDRLILLVELMLYYAAQGTK